MPIQPPTPASESWAEVRARDAVVRYRRSGAGPLVVLVAPEAAREGAFWPGLIDALAARFRVVAPELAPGDGCAGIAARLYDFLDGMGANGARIVAGGSSCVPALELALRDMDQIGRLVLVSAESSGDPPAAGMLVTSARSATIPLLVASRQLAAPEAIEMVVGFLGEAETGS